METAKKEFADVRYVGFWARVLAALIDTAWMLMIIGPILWAVYGAEYFSLVEGKFVAGPVDFFVQYLLPAIAVLIFWITRGATPGKMVVGAIVVDASTFDKLSVGQALLRYIGYYVSMIPLCLGLIWVAFDGRKQGWHDKIANTLVIQKPKAD